MNNDQMKECLNIVVQAERDLKQAKEDYKATVESAFETYEMEGHQEKAIKDVAKAMLGDKLQNVEDAANALIEVVDLLKK